MNVAFILVQCLLSGRTTVFSICFLCLGDFCLCACLVSPNRVCSYSGCWTTFSPSVDTMQHLALPFKEEVHDRHFLMGYSIFLLFISPVVSHHFKHLHRGTRESPDLRLLLCLPPCCSEKGTQKGKSKSCFDIKVLASNTP